MTNSFWTGGPAAYSQGLQRHYDAVIQHLRDQIKQSTDETVRSKSQAELNSVEEEYRRKTGEIGRLLF